MKKITKKWRLFLQQENGSHVIEMAFIMPVLFLLILSAIEFGLIMYASSLLDNIAAQAARYGKTGYDYGSGTDQTFQGGENEGFNPGSSDDHYSVDGSGQVSMRSREAYIREYVRGAGGMLLDPEKIHVTTELFADISSAGVSGVTATPYNFGAAAQAVTYNITYDWSILSPLLLFIGEDGIFAIKSTVVVQNEDF